MLNLEQGLKAPRDMHGCEADLRESGGTQGLAGRSRRDETDEELDHGEVVGIGR